MDEPSKSDALLRLRLPTAKQTIEIASKFIKRTIPQAEYWITNRHRWMHNIPTEECDVVITFSIGIEEGILMWLLSRLKITGLNVRVRHNPMTDCYQCYLTAPTSILLKYAEENHLPKRLNSEYGGGLKEFVRNEENKFEGFENKKDFFSMQERQWLILKLLETLRTRSCEEIGNEKFVEGQAIIPKCLSSGIIAQIYPVHETQTLKYLRKTWVRSVLNRQPIDEIADYFGVKIAMYFAWLGHYTRALTIPAVVGLVFWTVSFCPISQTVADTGFVLFSFFNVIWFSIYLEAWKRYCAELAYKWGTLDQRDELLIEPRPLFRGHLECSTVTGRLEPKYPSWKRNLFRYLISIPVIGICISIVVGIMVISFKFQNWWDEKIHSGGYFQCFTFLPKILLGIVISCLDEIYYKVARWLNDKENYRLDREYENNLIVKVATFQFVNSFISLFYIAFYLQDQERLKIQLAVLLITRQIIQNVKESALPYLIEQFRLAKLSFDIFEALSPSAPEVKKQFSDYGKNKEKRNHVESSTIPQAEVESTLFKYEGTFSEHLEMFIQLGYVVLFSSAFPMAAFCALVNNLIEIRSDAFKMCFIFQRPFGERVSSIGMWLNMMEVMGLIAVLVNCALIGLSGQVHRMFPNMSKTQTILLIVALEHIMLAIRFLISCAIPDKPDWVAAEMAKVEFARREALNRLSSTTTTPPSSTAVPTVPTANDISSGKPLDVPLSQNGGNFKESPFIYDAEDAKSESDQIFIDAVESDISQSVDNIDRILQNIEEETEGEPLPQPLSNRYSFKRNLSRDSESSGDFGSGILTTSSVKSRPSHSKLSISTEGAKDWASNSEHNLNQPGKVSWCRNEPVKIMATHDTSKSTSNIPSSQKDAMVSSAESVTSQVNVSSTNRLPCVRGEEKRDSASAGSETSSATEETPLSTELTIEKKKRLRSALIKRARSVAVFSLKLKERRIKSENKDMSDKTKEKLSPRNENNIMVGGELSCVPIEMLISMDDVNIKTPIKRNSGTPTITLSKT